MSVRRRVKKDPYTKDERDPLELLARLMVGGSYRIPVGGTGTKGGLQSSEIAAAVGYITDPLQREIAMAVSGRAGAQQTARLAQNVYRRCARAVRMMRPPRALKLHLPADRWRLRMVIYDVATELVWPERQRPIAELAKDTKMRRSEYARLHKVVKADLQELLNGARTEFKQRLFGN